VSGRVWVMSVRVGFRASFAMSTDPLVNYFSHADVAPIVGKGCNYVKRTPTVVLTQELINKSLQLKNFNKAAKI
jgi:hypothetical protein